MSVNGRGPAKHAQHSHMSLTVSTPFKLPVPDLGWSVDKCSKFLFTKITALYHYNLVTVKSSIFSHIT